VIVLGNPPTGVESFSEVLMIAQQMNKHKQITQNSIKVLMIAQQMNELKQITQNSIRT
jgi:hypothetical protein